MDAPLPIIWYSLLQRGIILYHKKSENVHLPTTSKIFVTKKMEFFDRTFFLPPKTKIKKNLIKIYRPVSFFTFFFSTKHPIFVLTPRKYEKVSILLNCKKKNKNFFIKKLPWKWRVWTISSLKIWTFWWETDKVSKYFFYNLKVLKLSHVFVALGHK